MAVILAIATAMMIASFLFSSLLVWIICLCFGLTFAWKYALGIWAIMLLLGGVFGGNSK